MRIRAGILLLCVCLLLVLVGCLTTRYKLILEAELEKNFPDRDASQYITRYEIKKLLDINDNSIFMNELLKLVSVKRFAPYGYSNPMGYDREYNFETIHKRLLKMLLSGKHQGEIVDVYTEINKNPSYDYVASIGPTYKYYYITITSLSDKVKKNTLMNFIDSLPNEKQYILAQYKVLQQLSAEVDDLKVDHKSFYNAYTAINRNNYEEILKKSQFFLVLLIDEELIKVSIEGFSYYYKLLSLKEEM